uniref:Uncharacterized protein n=1 Tax=Cannabis sativa TaxID=3483 RepID=A0A803NUK8_CANSA
MVMKTWLCFIQVSERDRCHNRILSILDATGNKLEDPEGITKAFLEFYQNLLGSKMMNKRAVDSKLIRNGACITYHHVQILTAHYTMDEVKEAIFKHSTSKGTGPDGYSNSFYQDNWDLIRHDVFEAVTSFLHIGQLRK